MSTVAGSTRSSVHRRRWLRLAGVLVVVYVVVVLALMWWWSYEPPHFDVARVAQERVAANDQKVLTGTLTTSTLMACVETLLDKRGGYISNDRFPPGVLMDNVPNWEFGVLTASRDLVRALRNDFSRSQTQSTEDKDLQEADPLLSYPNDRWLFASSESQYRNALAHIGAYLGRLDDDDEGNAQFYARADNLADYLQLVSTRLGSLSQRLSASVGQIRIDTDLAGDRNAKQSTPGPGARVIKTPWLKIDDNFYEARGYTWALREQLEAMRVDFGAVLRDKNAMVSLEQVTRELDESQKPMSSPMILNGSPFGLFANHSLVMANYISRANAAIIDLRELLKRG
ncbi:MAG: DUF2333 family protein [Rhodanobacteraceae bacterium]